MSRFTESTADFQGIGVAGEVAFVLNITQSIIPQTIEQTLGEFDAEFEAAALDILQAGAFNSATFSASGYDLLTYVDQMDFGVLVELFNNPPETLYQDVPFTSGETAQVAVFDAAMLIVRPCDVYLRLHVLKKIYLELSPDISSEERVSAIRIQTEIQKGITAMRPTNAFVSLLPERFMLHGADKWYVMDASLLTRPAEGFSFVDLDDIPFAVAQDVVRYEDSVKVTLSNAMNVPQSVLDEAFDLLLSYSSHDMMNAVKTWAMIDKDPSTAFVYDFSFRNFMLNDLADNPAYYALAYQIARKNVVVNVSDWFKGMNANIRSVAEAIPTLLDVYKSTDQLHYATLDFDILDVTGKDVESFMLNTYEVDIAGTDYNAKKFLQGLQSSNFVGAFGKLSKHGYTVSVSDLFITISDGSGEATLTADPAIMKLVQISFDAAADGNGLLRNLFELSTFIDLVQGSENVQVEDRTIVLFIERFKALRRLGVDIFVDGMTLRSTDG